MVTRQKYKDTVKKASSQCPGERTTIDLSKIQKRIGTRGGAFSGARARCIGRVGHRPVDTNPAKTDWTPYAGKPERCCKFAIKTALAFDA
jgi:hypothetical protein